MWESQISVYGMWVAIIYQETPGDSLKNDFKLSMVFCNLTIPISNPSVLDNQFPQSREQEAVQVTLRMHMIVFERTIMCSALVMP